MYFPPFSYSFPFFSFFFFFLCCAACFLLFYFLRHVLRCLVSFNRWWPDSKETTPNNPLALVLSIPRDHCVLLLFDSSSVWRVAKRKKIIKTKTKRQRTTQQGYTYIPSSTFILYRPSITLSLFRLSLSLSLSQILQNLRKSQTERRGRLGSDAHASKQKQHNSKNSLIMKVKMTKKKNNKKRKQKFKSFSAKDLEKLWQLKEKTSEQSLWSFYLYIKTKTAL